MTGGLARRTVEVSSWHAYGTGCLIAPGLVLTARHVVPTVSDDPVRVRSLGATAFTGAEVVWSDEALDAALLRTDRNTVGAGLPVVRFGEIVCDYADRRAVCTVTGFPKAMHRSAGEGRSIDDLKTVDGRIAPDTGSRSHLYAFDIDGSKPTDAAKWQGISGAGVFCGGMLVGLVRIVDRDWDGTLLALPLSHLLQADGFARTVAQHAGMPPRLQPADLQQLLDATPLPVLSSSHLLDPHSRVVADRSTSDLAGRIEQWCLDSRPLDVALVTGLGGTGKTRLIAEVLDRLVSDRPGRRPWSGGFLADKPVHRDYAMLGSGTYPLLIAVDLAETRIAQINDVATALAHRHTGDRIRIVLLARSAGHWWQSLQRHLRNQQVGPVSTIFPITSEHALGDSSPEDIYTHAKADFAARLRLLQKAGHGDDTWTRPVVADAHRLFAPAAEDTHGQPVIYHHVAALADVLAHANPDFALRDSPMDVLLANEENYLYRIARNHLPEGTLDTKLIRTLVVAQALAGARTVPEAAAAIQAAFHAHHHAYGPATRLEPQQVQALDTILTAAYPATDGAHWGAMGAVLAQALLTDVESDSGNAFVEQFLQHEDLADSQCHQTLSTIAHAAPQQPALAAAAHRAVAAQPRRLLPLAATAVAAQLPADQAQQWLTGVKSAVTERARQPAPDPATYRWAADYLDQIPQRPATDPGDQHKFVVLVDAVLAAAWVPAAVEPAASAAETTTDTAEDRRRFMGGRRFGESATIATAADAARRFLANMRASRSIRLLVTFLAACHLALVVRTTVAAMSSDTLRQEGWSRWFYLFFAVAINLLVPVTYRARRTTTIACISSFVVGVAAFAPFLLVISLAGHGSPPPTAPLFIFAFNLLVPILYDNGRTAVRRVITWIWLSLVVVAADTSFALLANPAAHGPLPPWAPWSVVFGVGLCALTLAWFIRAGRVPPA